MKVLIIAKYFAPQNTMGAVRPTKIAKYLHKKYNCIVDVVTMDKEYADIKDSLGEKDLQYVNHIFRASDPAWATMLTNMEYRIKRRELTKDVPVSANTVKWKTPDQDMSFVNRVYHSVQVAMEWMKESGYARNAYKRIKKSVSEYDIVFTTYGPLSSIILGGMIKKKNTEVFLISDFRDAIRAGKGSLFAMRIKQRLVHRITSKYSDAITTVSSGIAHDMHFENDNRLHVVTNGYDMEDCMEMVQRPNDCLTLTYTGVIYEGKQDISPLFHVIKSLEDEGKIDINKIKFQYAGPHFDLVEEMAKDFGVESILENQGLVERKKALELQVQADVLVLSTWNKKDMTIGWIGGKTYEYMMAKKPIIALITGDEPNSFTSEVINKGNIGFCYEECNKKTFEQLKGYLEETYNTFYAGIPIKYSPNSDYINLFNYECITEKLWYIFSKKQSV